VFDIRLPRPRDMNAIELSGPAQRIATALRAHAGGGAAR
jgi:hypothetical protein